MGVRARVLPRCACLACELRGHGLRDTCNLPARCGEQTLAKWKLCSQGLLDVALAWRRGQVLAGC